MAGKTGMAVAASGILVNDITTWLFASGAEGDINVRAAFLHKAADVAVSAGVVIAGLMILLKGRTRLDPIDTCHHRCHRLSTWGLLRHSLARSRLPFPRLRRSIRRAMLSPIIGP